MKVQRIGIDLAKQMVQVHGGEHHGKVVLRKQRTRGKIRAFIAQLSPCLIGMEACARAHYWARAFSQLGHTVRLMAPQLVRPSRKNPKHEGNDAEAICEAGSRPTMRVVPAQSVAQQAVLMVHRARELSVGDRPALAKQIRGRLTEDGSAAPPGIARRRRALPLVLEAAEHGLPGLAREVIAE
jgi:transposase